MQADEAGATAVQLAAIVCPSSLSPRARSPSRSTCRRARWSRRCLIGDALVAIEISLRLRHGVAADPDRRCRETGPAVSASCRERGDVVVFRWPGDRSQAWVKRVIGLPGDRIQMRQGQLWINGHPATLKPDGIGEADGRPRQHRNRLSLYRDAAERRQPRDLQDASTMAASTTRLRSPCRPESCSCSATTATIPPTAASRCATAASDCCRSTTLSAAPMSGRLLGHGFMRSQPVWTWPSGFRLARFFLGALSGSR